MSAVQREQDHEYVLGTDQSELIRLGLQHRLWAGAAHTLWMKAGLQPGSRVLDVGCGPGYAGLEMAMVAGPRGRVFGVDASASFVAHAREQAHARGLPQFDAARGDVQDLGAAVPASEEAFDIAYTRWVLCFVRDPARVVDGVCGLLRAGGRFIMQDYFNYVAMRISPEVPSFDAVRRAAAKSWADQGGDSDVMGRMPKILRERGFEIESFTVDQRIARPGEPMWAWPDVFWVNYVPRLVASGQLSRSDAEAFTREWEAASRNPDTFFALPAVYEIIAVKR
jgi:SAM-dependent methyltransferase